MKPVDQTRFGGPDAPPDEVGDCFAACMASILELPLASVPPDLGSSAEWFGHCNDWLRSRGLALISFNWDVDQECAWPKGAWHILSGRSPRGDWDHSTVGVEGAVVHDPHPSRGGLRGTKRQVDLFVAIDPSKWPPP